MKKQSSAATEKQLLNGFHAGFGVGSRLFLGLQFTRLSKLLLKTIYAAFGIDELLPPCEERVAA
jgi:hypothetical protein